MSLLEPLGCLELVAVILLYHLVPHGRDQDALGSLWLSKAVIGGDDLLDSRFGIVLEFHFPIVECLGVSIALLGDFSQRSLIEDFLLVFVKFHELV